MSNDDMSILQLPRYPPYLIFIMVNDLRSFLGRGQLLNEAEMRNGLVTEIGMQIRIGLGRL